MAEKFMTEEMMNDCINLINEEINEKGEYERPAWKGIVELLEESDFGRKDAEVEIELQNIKNEDPLSPMALARFETVQLKVLEICHSILEEYGKVNLIPFSEGMLSGRKCMTLTFKAK